MDRSGALPSQAEQHRSPDYPSHPPERPPANERDCEHQRTLTHHRLPFEGSPRGKAEQDAAGDRVDEEGERGYGWRAPGVDALGRVGRDQGRERCRGRVRRVLPEERRKVPGVHAHRCGGNFGRHTPLRRQRPPLPLPASYAPPRRRRRRVAQLRCRRHPLHPDRQRRQVHEGVPRHLRDGPGDAGGGVQAHQAWSGLGGDPAVDVRPVLQFLRRH